MASFQWFLSTILLYFMVFTEQGNARLHRGFLRKQQMVNLPTVYVDPSGHGNFSTIQSAINSVPLYNQNWMCIYVKAGQYREKLKIPREKPYIFLKGEGIRKTNVTWDAHELSNIDATFTSEADYTFVKSITFINSYNYPIKGILRANLMQQAVAAMISGDKSTFYRCGFFSLQDTLWDFQGRHYFKLCTIEGAVDFIFGAGQSIYEGCKIKVNAGTLDNLIGYITAQGRSNANDESGFVFNNCNIFGTGQAYLGRPWRNHARVLFHNCSMSNVVFPQGWDAWLFAGQENKLTFSEANCTGLGSNSTQRVSWEARLSQQELKYLTNISFIDNEGWIMKQPIKVL